MRVCVGLSSNNLLIVRAQNGPTTSCVMEIILQTAKLLDHTWQPASSFFMLRDDAHSLRYFESQT